MKGKFLCILLLICFFVSSAISQEKSNVSISLLNYLATETRIINDSRDNRLALEEIYNTLVNNTNPTVVDKVTQEFLQDMLESIESFRMISAQRERLRFLLDNSQAQAIMEVIPTPLYVLGNIYFSGQNSVSPLAAITGVVSMGLDAVARYRTAKNANLLNFLKDKWELDDSEMSKLHNLRMKAFQYMINITRENDLSVSDTLNEESIDGFVKDVLDSNLQRKKQFLEDHISTYEKYGPFWLELADVYYKLALYQECLNAISKYETIQAPIFRKDYDYAKVLPEAIIAASIVYKDEPNTFAANAGKFGQKIIQNTNERHWSLRYFAAQTYIGIALGQNKETNLNAAYNLLLNNVVYLSREQEKMLNSYFNPIDEKIPPDLTDSQKKQAAKIIKDLKKYRKTELPPLNQALWLNYTTLLKTAEESHKSKRDLDNISAITNEAFFAMREIDKYRKKEQKDIASLFDFHDSWSRNVYYLECPDIFLTTEALLSLELQDQDGNTIWKDDKVQWKVISINRDSAQGQNRLSKVKLKLTLHNSFKVSKQKELIMTARINNIKDSSIYGSVLYFHKPAGISNWSISHIE
ncbi:MAG: hypothetical protein LBV66_02480 [Elusimicrobiota bacterium]|jgi:hypothetical protein|nr:hypothetical protein [Elusimicrobiota bacterium]